MNTLRPILSMLKADLLERTRGAGYLLAVFLGLTLGYSVNSGDIFIQLGGYRGAYNSAWIGSLMALTITFFLGVFGFYLVKGGIQRDERGGVGQILAATTLTRPQYLLGKWLSNFAVLASLVGLLAVAALLMALLKHEGPLELGALLAPLCFVALPMLSLVAALAVLFESIPWLKGGLGNMLYFGVFAAIFIASSRLEHTPVFDVTGMSLFWPSMKSAAAAAYAGYDGGFTLGMSGRPAQGVFTWPGIDWNWANGVARLAWVAVSAGLALLGAPFFRRFDADPHPRRARQGKESGAPPVQASIAPAGPTPRLSSLAGPSRWRANGGWLTGLEFKLLVKGLKWFEWAGLAGLWAGCALAPAGLRNYAYLLASLWPVLVWSRLGQRETHERAGELIFPHAHAAARLTLPALAAGVIFTALATSGVLLGRALAGQPLDLLAWALSVAFIPTLALALGVWSGGGRAFQVVYFVLWFLGPFNAQNQLSGLDYLGLHAGSPAFTMPVAYAGGIIFLALLAYLGRRRPVHA